MSEKDLKILTEKPEKVRGEKKKKSHPMKAYNNQPQQTKSWMQTSCDSKGQTAFARWTRVSPGRQSRASIV